MRYVIVGVLGFVCGLAISAWAQPATTPGQTAVVCAFSSVTPNGPATGNFILAQCDSFGRLRTVTGGWP